MPEKPDELNLDELDKASGGIGSVPGDLIGAQTTDQASRFAGSISNILKKFSATASSIISNLK